MKPINVPKPPKKAFNPNRPASDLLRSQVEHLEWAVRHAGQRRKGYRIKPVRTEADAAHRMAQLIPRLESAGRLPFTATEISVEGTTAKAQRQKKARKRQRKRTTGRRKKR